MRGMEYGRAGGWEGGGRERGRDGGEGRREGGRKGEGKTNNMYSSLIFISTSAYIHMYIARDLNPTVGRGFTRGSPTAQWTRVQGGRRGGTPTAAFNGAGFYCGVSSIHSASIFFYIPYLLLSPEMHIQCTHPTAA